MTAAMMRPLRVLRPSARLMRPTTGFGRVTLPSPAPVPALARSVTATTKGDTPNATNIAKDSPKSDSPQDQGIKSSRGPGSGEQDTASVAEPTSQVGSGGGQDEEGGAPGTKDPKKPASEKSAEVQKEGMKPLDPADK